MDFDLYSLGSRLFEHMIQSLLTRVLGPEIVQYGDGPDGGRETVFDGEYKLGGRTLKGYGVVQVKHRLRRGSAADENNWAHVQLRRELDAFQDPRRKRRTPLNYIYVVNVHLSSTAGTGGRDRIESLFKDAQKRGRGFRNYIVWDATDVSRLLEANAEVRRTYAPFLLTSGLLSDVIDTAVLHAGGQAAHDAILTFLEKELLADQSGTFDPRGGDGRSMPPITVGFMDLPAKADVASFSWPVGRGVVRTVIDLSTPLNQPSTNANTFRQAGNTRILLVGGPGQGKSTISKFIAQIHRLAILSVSEVMTPEAHRVALQLGEAMSDQKISLPANRRFPVRIELKAFAQWLSSRQSGSVLQYVAERITSLSGALFERQSVAEWLKAYPWLVILDGLDEVPGTANRDALLQALSEFWVDITRSRANIVTLITTRPQGYHGEVDVNIRLDLEQLEPSVAVKYGRHLIEARFGADRDRVEELCTRLERASENSATARLMTTPLQTAIMSVLVEEVGVPPKQRWRLFKLYFDAIYKRERNRNLATSELLADHENVIVKLHRAVGLGLQVMSVKRGGPDCTIDLHTLSGIIKCLLEDEGYEGEPLTTLTQEILACATDRLVFLVGHTGDTLGFELRSLQEFMAAEALSDDDDEKVQTRLEAIATCDAWLNVFLFAAGRVFGEDTHRRDRLMSILASLDTGSLGVLPSSVRAGAVAAVELLEDASAQNAPRYTKQLAERASGVLELVTESLSARLGRTVDSNTEKLILSSVESRLNSGDPLVRRSSLAVIAAGAEKGSKSFTQQLDAIIKAGGGSAVEMTEIAFGQRIDVEVLRVLARTAEGNGPFVAVRCFAKLYRRQRTIQSVDNRSPSSRLLRQAPAWLRGIAVVSRMGTGSGLTNFQLENLPPWYRIGINTGALSDGDAEALRALVGNKAAGAEWDVVRALAAVYLNRSAESTSVLRDSMALWHSSNPPESDRKLLFTATPWNVRLAIDHPELGLSWSHAEKIQESWHSTGISDVDWTSKVAEYAVSVLTSGTWSDSSVKVRAAMKRLERQGRGSRRWWALGIGALEMYRACPKEIAPLDFIEYVLMCEPTGVGNKEIVPIIRFPSGISGRQLAWIRRIFEHLPLAGPLHEETERALLVAAERYDDLSVFELLARGSIDAFDNVADRALALATPRPGDASPALLGKLWQSKVTHNIGKCHTLVNLSKASAFDDVGVSHLIECIASQNAHRIERQDLVAHLLASSRSPKVVSAARAVVARLLSPFEDLDDWVDLGLGRQVGVCFFVTGL